MLLHPWLWGRLAFAFPVALRRPGSVTGSAASWGLAPLSRIRASLGWAFPSRGLWLLSRPCQIALISLWGPGDVQIFAVALSKHSLLSLELPRAARAGSGEALSLPEAHASCACTAQNGDISLLLFLSLKPSWL